MELSLFQQVFYVGVLAGLAAITYAIFYLARQLQQHAETTRYNTHISFLGKFLDFNIALGQNKELSDVYQRGLRGIQGLGREEVSQFFSIATYMFNFWNEAYRGATHGDIPNDYWNEARAIMTDFVRFPGVQEYWQYRKHWYSQDLQILIDGMIEAMPEGSAPVYPTTLT